MCFFPSLPLSLQNALEVKDTCTGAKKGGGEMNNKRGRSEAASSTLPPFKVHINFIIRCDILIN